MSLDIRGAPRRHLRAALAIGRSLGGLLLLALLAGCVLDAGVPKPTPIAPDQYRAGDSKPSVWPAPGWWQNFGSPSLDQLVRDAKTHNYDIAAAVARVAQANAQVRISGAPLLPSLSGKGTVSRNYQGGQSRSNSVSVPNGNGGTTTTSFSSGGASVRNNYQAALSASYELDFWGENLASLKSAKRSALASRYDAATVALSTEASVATTYFTIVSTQRRIDITENNLATARQLLDVLQAQLRVGITNALDVAQQETQVANLQASIPPLRQQLRRNINALAVLVGKPPAALDVDIAKLSNLTVPSIGAGLPSTLLTRRPDIAEARAKLAAARYDVSSARAALFPTFDLTAQGGWQQAMLGGLFNPVNEFYSLVGNITQPIFQGGRLRGQVSLDRARYAELLADYQSTVINAFEDVDNALVDVRQTAAQEKQQAQAVKLAARALKIARARLHAGITDVTSVLDTEQTLFSARDTLAQAEGARLQAAVSLYQALGGGWNENDLDETKPHDATAASK